MSTTTPIFNIDDDDGDDDDEIILVSSTRQRYEKLHGIDSKKKNRLFGDNKNNLNNYNSNNNDSGNNDDEDDEIIVVKVRPPTSRKKHGLYQRVKNFFQLGRISGDGGSSGDHIIKNPSPQLYSLSQQLLTLLIIVLSIIMIQRNKRFRFRQRRSRSRSRSRSINDTTKVITIETEAAETETTTTKIVNNNNNNITTRNSRNAEISSVMKTIASIENENKNGEFLNVEEEEKKKAGNEKIAIDGVTRQTPTQTQTWQSHQIIAQQGSLSSSLLSSSSSSPSNIIINEQRDSSSSSSQAQKLHMARQIAKDIRLVQDVLIEHSLDPGMAAQLAISLQSSQHIVESQRDMCYQQAMLDVHQRQLDRQQSERQHRESLQGVKYDPNWKEKLKSIRNKCYYWNLLGYGGVSRLWWEVILIQQLVRWVIPVWQYYYNYHYLNNINFNNGSTNIMYGNNGHENGQLAAAFIKDTIISILTQVCDCQSSCIIADTSTADIPTTIKSNSSWFPAAVATVIISLNTSIMGNTLSSFVAVLSSVLKQFVPHNIMGEYMTCYGYCILCGSVLLMMTMILHQGLRILSVPALLHHIVNIASLSLFYGPQRTFVLFLTTMMRMVMIVTVDDHNDDVNISSNSTAGQQQQHHQSSNSMIGCSFLLISLWVLLPLISWIRTSTLYYKVERCVENANPIDFETAFGKGGAELKRWRWEQILIRYILLSMYSTLVMWESLE
jgi:hypothetical protein